MLKTIAAKGLLYPVHQHVEQVVGLVDSFVAY